jgi:hypothetical protein
MYKFKIVFEDSRFAIKCRFRLYGINLWWQTFIFDFKTQCDAIIALNKYCKDNQINKYSVKY